MQGCFEKRLLTACIGAISVSWAPPCLPADAAPSEPSPSARAHYERGVKAYEQGRYRHAVELFIEADRLSPSARSSFNIGKVYERMGDEQSALGAYRNYLRRLPTAENGVEVARRITELEAALALQGVQQLSVMTTPTGAELLIDDAPRGTTPWTGELRPGLHRLVLRLSEHHEARQVIELGAQHAMDVNVQLEPAASLVSAPNAASIVTSDAVVPSGGAIWPEPVVPWDRLPLSTVAEPLPRSEAEPVLRAESAPVRAEPAPGWLTWSLFAGSAAALVGAGSFELARREMEERADSPIQVVHEDKYAAMERRQTAARVFLGAGIATALAGSIALYFDLKSPSEELSEVELGCATDECGLAVGGRF